MDKIIRFIDIETGEVLHEWRNGHCVFTAPNYYTTKEEVVEVKIEQGMYEQTTFVYVRLTEV